MPLSPFFTPSCRNERTPSRPKTSEPMRTAVRSSAAVRSFAAFSATFFMPTLTTLRAPAFAAVPPTPNAHFNGVRTAPIAAPTGAPTPPNIAPMAAPAADDARISAPRVTLERTVEPTLYAIVLWPSSSWRSM